jgi:hypothetical protein
VHLQGHLPFLPALAHVLHVPQMLHTPLSGARSYASAYIFLDYAASNDAASSMRVLVDNETVALAKCFDIIDQDRHKHGLALFKL